MDPHAYNQAHHVMSEVFAVAGSSSISDIQIRSGSWIYCHTKKGLEIVRRLGELPAEVVMNVVEYLYSRQESESVGAMASLQNLKDVKQRLFDDKVADFSTEGFPLPDGSLSGRMRVQAHLSTSGPGLTCRILSDEIADLNTLGIGPDTTRALTEFMKRRQGFGLVTGQTGSGKSTSSRWKTRLNIVTPDFSPGPTQTVSRSPPLGSAPSRKWANTSLPTSRASKTLFGRPLT